MSKNGTLISVASDQDGADVRIVTETNPFPVGLFDGAGNPIDSLRGAIDVHDADVHDVPVNELFHRHTGVTTTVAVAVSAGATSITVANGAAFTNGRPFQIESATTVESTFPIIISGGGTNTFTLDRPLDNSFSIGDSVEEVTTNMAVLGTRAAPVSFKLLPDINQEWHIVRFLIAMELTTAGDDSRFGNIAGGLTNGCVLRAYNGATGQYRTFTNWKTNFDIGMDMYDFAYIDKAGSGNFGVRGRGSIKKGTGAVPKLIYSEGSYLELLVQDNLTGLIRFNLKSQGHIKGL